MFVSNNGLTSWSARTSQQKIGLLKSNLSKGNLYLLVHQFLRVETFGTLDIYHIAIVSNWNEFSNVYRSFHKQLIIKWAMKSTLITNLRLSELSHSYLLNLSCTLEYLSWVLYHKISITYTVKAFTVFTVFKYGLICSVSLKEFNMSKVLFS